MILLGRLASQFPVCHRAVLMRAGSILSRTGGGLVHRPFPFSLAEVLILGGSAFGIGYLIWRSGAPFLRRPGWRRSLKTSYATSSPSYRQSAACSCWGLRAELPPPALLYYSGLTVRESTAGELAALCEELIHEANRLRQASPRTVRA
jgi:hypothetical protein